MNEFSAACINQKKTSGLLHLYIGNGKGKSTAAAGMAVRMAGHGFKVLYAQFLKPALGGEVLAFSGMLTNIELLRFNLRHQTFVFQQTQQERQETCEDLQIGWKLAASRLDDSKYRLFVFDELLDMVDLSFITTEELVEALASRHPGAEVVITGRKASAKLKELADYITVMEAEKHPFDRGVKGRKGVEW